MEKEYADQGFMKVGPLRLYYEIHGTGGIPLVLIHGGGSTFMTSFGTILGPLSRTRRVIGIELQGHGHTGELDRPYSFTQDADDVAGVLQGLAVTRADFLGFSNGGSTALQIGLRHPDIVHRLIVASCFYRRDAFVPGFFDALESASMDGMPETLKRAYMSITHDPHGLETMHRKDRERMVGFSDWPDTLLRGVQAPTLVMGGDRDMVLPSHFVQMVSVIPTARLMILPGNHGSYLGELAAAKPGDPVPELAVSVMEAFLDELY